MDKLTIKELEKQLHQAIKQHVAFGAPIEILNYKQDYVGIQYSKANGYYMLAGDIYITYDGGSTGKSVKDFRFLLRPLFSLTEEIEHNGEVIDPIQFITQNRDCDAEYEFIEAITDDWASADSKMKFAPYSIMKKLFEWHFDVFGLIDRGLALPIGKEETNG